MANVTREDCARTAAAALTSSFTGQRILNIKGAKAYSSADIASIASEITGQPLNYVPVELEAIIQGMVGAGLPRPIPEIFASFNTATKQGQFQVVSNDYEELTGQKPTPLRDFLTEHEDALVPA